MRVVQNDFISLDLFKDEIIAINSNNSVSFIPLNEDVSLAVVQKFWFPIPTCASNAPLIVPTIHFEIQRVDCQVANHSVWSRSC
jgi:hypothetical protein